MNRRTALHVGIATGLFGLVALTGCDSPGMKAKAKSPNQVAQQQGAVGQTTTTGAALPNAGGPQAPVVFTPNLTISDAIALACGIAPRGDKKLAPSFEFDSSSLAEADRQVLAEVAKCLTEGALRGKAISLVGRADARGEEEYNMTLGESRADAVKRYFVGLGVGKDRAHATSRGELDATGKDEAGYAQDRRVDIELAQ